MRSRLRLLRALALSVVAWAAPAARADAPVASQCTVTEIRASNEKQGVDAKLDRLKAKLTKPPFSSYDTFKLLGEQTVTAERMKPLSAKLVNGNLTLLFKDKTVVTGGRSRLRLGIDVDNKQGERIISTESKIDSGDPLFIAGQPFEGGTYVLVLTCSAP